MFCIYNGQRLRPVTFNPFERRLKVQSKGHFEWNIPISVTSAALLFLSRKKIT